MVSTVLTTSKINSLKPKEKAYKVSDAHGLFLFIRPTGTKTWQQKYRYNGKEKLLTHGKYPVLSLAEARTLRDAAIKQLSQDIDPSKAKRQAKARLSNTFDAVAKEWFDKERVNWKPDHAAKVWRQLDINILPFLKDEPIDKISPTDLLEVLKKIESRGALYMASRLRQRCEKIFQHAILTERLETNPASQLSGVLKTKKIKHMNALSTKELPEFFTKLEGFDSHPVVKMAVKLIAHTFIRTSELRFTVWSEIDFEERLWLIPADRMKMDSDHLVPLTDQVIAMFRELQKYNGDREFVFASPSRPNKPLSQNAMIQLMYRMGYKGKATVHGFRSTASTYLNESGYNPDAIERQLSHTERNQVRAAYNRSEYLEERTKLLHDWSRYLDSISTTVVPIRKSREA